MITFACSGEELAAAVLKPQAKHVAVRHTDPAYVDGLVTVSLIYVDADGKIMGDEANDYRPKEGEVPVWLID